MRRSEEHACDQVQHIVGTVTQGNAVSHNTVQLGQSCHQLVTATLRVTCHVRYHRLGRSHCQRTRTERILVRGQFDGIANAVLALQFLDRLARLVGLQGTHTGCGKAEIMFVRWQSHKSIILIVKSPMRWHQNKPSFPRRRGSSLDKAAVFTLCHACLDITKSTAAGYFHLCHFKTGFPPARE